MAARIGNSFYGAPSPLQLKRFMLDVKDPRLSKMTKTLTDKVCTHQRGVSLENEASINDMPSPQLAEQYNYVNQKRSTVPFDPKSRNGPARLVALKKGPLSHFILTY